MENISLIIVALVSFAVVTISGKWMIPFLRRLKFGQTIREIGPTWHKNKQGTPTMGGLMLMLGFVMAMIISVPIMHQLGIGDVLLMNVKIFAGVGMAIAFGIIGFMDDYISIVKKRNLGLTEKQKLFLQFAVAIVYLLSIYFAGGNSETIIPFLGTIDLGYFYYALAAILIVGIVNAVNFTDGIDGLNTTVTFFVVIVFALCASLLSMTAVNMMALAAAGACLGFLIWNFYPAKVFMGDTGSLFLGGLVCALAFALDLPILLLPVGAVYICEILSVVIQTTYFKATKGKRIFKMAPIHHHFEMCGWGEIKICVVFSLVTVFFSAISVAAVYYGV